jgi:hypothetical protein
MSFTLTPFVPLVDELTSLSSQEKAKIAKKIIKALYYCEELPNIHFALLLSNLELNRKQIKLRVAKTTTVNPI